MLREVDADGSRLTGHVQLTVEVGAIWQVLINHSSLHVICSYLSSDGNVLF